MTAKPSSLRFFVDESALGLGKTLAAARSDTIHTGHPLIPECPVGVLDVDWIPVVARRELVVIGRDKRIRTKPAEVRQVLQAGLRVLQIGGKRDLSTWDWLVRLVQRWDDIEDLLRQRPVGPWFYIINESGLSEITTSP